MDGIAKFGEKFRFVPVSSTNLDSITISWSIPSTRRQGCPLSATSARLIETVDPQVIVPMHTERAEEFSSPLEFAPTGTARVLKNGEMFHLDALSKAHTQNTTIRLSHSGRAVCYTAISTQKGG